MSVHARPSRTLHAAISAARRLPTRCAPLLLAVLMTMAAIGMPVARLCHSAAHHDGASVRPTAIASAAAVTVIAHDESTCLLCQYLAARHDATTLDEPISDTPIARLIGSTATVSPTASWSITLETKEARGPPTSC